MRFGLVLFCAAIALAQDPVAWVRAGGPQTAIIDNFDANGIETMTPHGLNTGDVVIIYGVCADTNKLSSANGARKVVVTDTTHFQVTDLNDNPIAPNGPYCTGETWHDNSRGHRGRVGKAIPLTLTGGNPRGWFAGWNDPAMRAVATGMHNGLARLAVGSNHVATITFSYDPALNVGDKLAIWGTSSNALNRNNTSSDGTPYTVVSTGGGDGAWTVTVTAPASVAAGDYTNNQNNGVNNNGCGFDGVSDLGGGQSCVRISQRAYIGNIVWDRLGGFWPGTSYLHYFDGGNQPLYYDAATWAAIHFLADARNRHDLQMLRYFLNTAERMLGSVNFPLNEAQTYGGLLAEIETASFGNLYSIAFAYSIGRDYLTPTERQLFLDKMYNDLDDNCTKPLPEDWLSNQPGQYNGHEVLATGTIQGGDATHITLADSDTQADGYYVNNVIGFMRPGVHEYYGLVTAYDATTKVATVTEWRASWGWGHDAYSPTAGWTYKVYASVTRNGTTITGYNTHFTRYLAAGDSVTGRNGWEDGPVADSMVVSVDSDTQVTVINNQRVSANGVPSQLMFVKKWSAANKSCGYVWAHKHSETMRGVPPTSYPPDGGAMAIDAAGGNNNVYSTAMAHMYLGLALYDDDPRARADFANASAWGLDYYLRPTLNFQTGFQQSGINYGIGRTLSNIQDLTWLWGHTLPNFPDIDLNGPWIKGVTLFKMYNSLSDNRFGMLGYHTFGNQSGDAWGHPAYSIAKGSSSGAAANLFMDPGLVFRPDAPETKRFKDFLVKNGYWISATVFSTYIPEAISRIDPRIGTLDYKAQPLQYLFRDTSIATCRALTGWTCPDTFRADAVISRTGWQDVPNATHVLYRSMSDLPDHDFPSQGQLHVSKVGELITNDARPAGEATQNATEQDSMISFGPPRGSYYGQVHGTDGVLGMAPIVRWASANHGGWETNYGDALSRYAYWMSDLGPAYRAAYTRVNRHVAHLKAGIEEILIEYDDVDAGSPVAGGISTHVHYANTGETDPGTTAYPEGNTNCPGPNGCAGLNIDRIMLSQESGAPADASGPARTNGILTRFFSPVTIAVRYDGIAASNNPLYQNGLGHTARVSICAGASCGATAQTFEQITVHKITSSLDDTSFEAAPLNPDGNWTGVQTRDKVVLFARQGALLKMAAFTTTHAGSAQYLIAGLAAGTYTVTVSGGNAGTALVTDGDNTLYFESTAGEVRIVPVARRTGRAAISIGTRVSGTAER